MRVESGVGVVPPTPRVGGIHPCKNAPYMVSLEEVSAKSLRRILRHIPSMTISEVHRNWSSVAEESTDGFAICRFNAGRRNVLAGSDRKEDTLSLVMPSELASTPRSWGSL